MLNFTKRVNQYLLFRPKITYSIFDSIAQSNINEDE